MSYKTNIYLLFIIEFTRSLYLIKIINTLFYQVRGMTLAQVGLLLGTYQFSKMIFEIPTGIVADKYGRKISMIIGLTLLEFYLLFTMIGNSFNLFIIATIIQGIAFTFISGVDSALFVDSIIADNQKSNLSKYSLIKQIIFYSSLAFSALFGGILASKYSYSFVYLIQMIFFAVPIVLMFFIKETNFNKNSTLEPISSKVIFKYILNNKILINFILIHVFIGVAFIPIDSYYSNFLIVSKITEEKTGLIMFVQQIFASIIILTFMNKIKDKHKDFLLVFLPLLMMTCLFIAFFYNNIKLSIFFYFIGQLCFILVNPILFEKTHTNIPSEYRASIGSFFSLSLAIVAVISHYFFGIFSKIYGLKNVFTVFVVISFILLIFNSKNFIFAIEEK